MDYSDGSHANGKIISVIRAFIIIAILLFNTQAYAGCYTPAEVEAEQGLRISSELMVISLNCQHVAGANGDLYHQYQIFTNRHRDLIMGYEQTMKNYYTRIGSAHPEKDIHDLRTVLANKISTDAAKMRPNVFCKYYGGRINQALQMDHVKLRRWASTIFPSHPVSRSVCVIQQ